MILLLFGAGLTLGNAIGGRLGDWKLIPTIIIGTVALIAIQVAFRFASTATIPAAATVFLWGFLVFVIIPSIQMQVLHAASGAPALASTLNQSAFNLGNAAGAWLGGVALESGVSYANLPFIGALGSLLCLGLVLATYLQERRARRCANDNAPQAQPAQPAKVAAE
jgi:DHA1 family inner membrane transport protein